MDAGTPLAHLYPDLPSDPQFDSELADLQADLRARERQDLSLSKIEPIVRLNACILLTYLSTKSPAFEKVTLQTLLDRMTSPADPVASLKTLFAACEVIAKDLKRETPAFTTLQSTFSFYSMFFSSLLKFTHIDFLRSLDTRSVQMIWLTFLRYTRALDHNRLDKRFNMLCSLIFSCIYRDDDTPERLQEMNVDFEGNLGFRLGYEEYQAKKKMIETSCPTFGTPEYDVKAKRKEQLDSLGRLDVNMTWFFQSMETETSASLTLTPVNRRSLSRRSSQANPTVIYDNKANQEEMSGNLSFGRDCGFAEVTEIYRSPKNETFQSPKGGYETGRSHGRSAELDRSSQFSAGESKDHVRKLCSALQWYKDQVKSVKLEQHTPATGEPLVCSKYFLDFLDDPAILDNLRQSLQVIRSKSPDADLPAFFYAILDRLILRESLSSNQTDVRNLIKENNFLRSVVCFTLDLSASINRTSPLKFEEVLRLCRCGHIDVWKIINNFIRSKNQDLPHQVKLRVYELEADILLRAIWTQSPAQRCLAYAIFASTNVYADLAIQRILRLLAERIFLIATKLQLCKRVTDTIWEMTKKLLFYGLDDDTADVDIGFKTNVHLDTLLLATIYHVSYANNQYVNMTRLLEAYAVRVPYALSIAQTELQSFYNADLKRRFKQLSDDMGFNCRVSPYERESRNGTPIQTSVWKRKKAIVGTPIEKSLPNQLGKRGQPSPEVPPLPGFAGQARPKISGAVPFGAPESPSVSRQNEAFLFNIPFGSPSPSTNTNMSPFFFEGSLHGSANRRHNENDPCVVDDTGIQTPTFK